MYKQEVVGKLALAFEKRKTLNNNDRNQVADQ